MAAGTNSMKSRMPLLLLTILSAVYFLVQFVVAHITHSVTLLTESYHMLYNVLSLVGCCIAVKMSNETTLKNTFGWARIEVLGMLISVLTLLALYFSVAVEALQTLFHIEHHESMHQPLVVGIVGAIGLALNMSCFALIGGYSHFQGGFVNIGLQKDEVQINLIVKSQVPLRGSCYLPDNRRKRDYEGCTGACMGNTALDFLRDNIGCMMVIACSFIVYYCNRTFAKYSDPALSLILVVILVGTSIPIIKESSMILMQTVPQNINVDTLRDKILKAFPSVINIHDIHVWRLNKDKTIATAHIICPTPGEYTNIASQIQEFLKNEGIHVSTIQPEFPKPEEDNPDVIKSSEKMDCMLNCTSDNCQAKTCCKTESSGGTLRKRAISRSLQELSSVHVQADETLAAESSKTKSVSQNIEVSANVPPQE